jgi:type I restriction enzyme S subunit
VLRSSVVERQLDVLMIGATFKRINVEEIRGLIVPMPGGKEQAKIADALIKATESLDVLIAQAERSIALLIERRAALISDAVTGQIDVRPESLRNVA